MDHFSSIGSLGEWRSVIYGGIVILTSLLLIKSALFSWRLPPGPRQLPFIGNVLQISSGSEWLQYNRWSKLYGPIFSLSAFGDRVVVLNSQAVANDVLEKNAKLYASRPRLILASDLIGWRNAVALNPGGQQHATYRKIMTKALNTAAIRKHRPLQEQYSETLIRNILATPADFYDHIRSAVGMQLATIVYGMYPTVHGKEYVAFAEEVHEVFAQTAKSYASIIDFVPIARYVPSWVPGFSFMKKVPEWRKDLFELMQVPFDAYKASFARGEAPPSYVADSLSATGASTIRSATEADVKWTAVGLYTGGVDTTVAGVTASILMLLLHPEVQKKAQQEIDELLGGVGVRLPVFDDLPKLKYIPAIVKEILRYWTLAPIGLPHRADSSGVYDGYDIPKDTTIVANIWGIMHDENVYQDAFSFKPERFLSKSDGGLEEPDPTATVFGYGRRICPGQHLAEATLNIYLTRIVSLLSIDPLKDANGNMVLPNEADLKGPDIISIPKRFQCDISPRSASAAALIAQ